MAFGAKIKLSVNTSGASAFRSEIQKYVNTATASNPIKLKNFSVSITKEQQRKIIRDIQAYLLSDNNALTLKIGKIDATGAVNKLRQQLQTMLSGLSITGLKEFLGETNIDKITEDVDNAKRAASQWAAQMRVVDDISKRLGSTYKTALSGSNMLGDSSQLAEITTAYTAWQTKVEALRETQTAMSTEELQNLQNEGIEIQRLISSLQERQAATTRAANEAERAEKQAEINARKELLLAQQQVSLKSQVQRYILSNSKAYKSYGAELDGIMQMLQSEARLTDEELKQIRRRFIEIQSSAKAAGKTGNTFFDTLKKGWEKFGGWSIVTRTMVAAWRVVVNMITAVKELDAAMTELKKVTDLSEQSYQKYLATAQKLSVTVGATLADTVNATADFARLGYTVSEATSLAEAALVYKNVGDGIDDISMATESLVSTIKAFGIEAENALSIVDKFNEVGNRFAISSDGIGTALQKSASALAAANNSLEESIALVTGMNAVIQNPEVVGTALKTVSMYLRAAKTEAEEAGEATDGMANSVSELRAKLLTLTNNKVDIMLDDKSFKSTYQIMKELSEVWNELSDIDAANILELIGGKRNATAITSLLTNFEDAEKSLTTASAAAGSAMAENEKFLDSIAGKLSILESKFETFSTNLIDSGAIKFVVDLGSGLLTLLDLLNQIYLLLPLLGASATLVFTAVQSQKVSAVTTQIVLQKQAILDQKVATESLAVSLSGLSAKEQQHLIVQLQRKVAAGELTAEQYQQIVATLGLSSAEKGLVAADGTLIAANKGLAASFKSLMASVPIWGWIALGISLVLEFATVISDLVGDIETSAEKIARLDKEFEEITETIKGVVSDYSELKKNVDDIIPRFTELCKGVDKFGNRLADTNGKMILSEDEYEEFWELNNKLAEMFPELDSGIDSNGNHILALSYSVGTLTESLQALVEAERMAANEEIAGNLGDALKNIKGTDKAYDKEIKALENRKSNYQEAFDKINLMYSERDKYEEAYGNRWLEQYRFDVNQYIAQIRQAFGSSNDQSVVDAWQKMIDKHTDGYGVIDWHAVINSDEFKNQMSVVDRELDTLEEKQSSRWQKLNPIMGAWLQTTNSYATADDNVQLLLSKVIGNIDYSEIGITNEKRLREYIQTNFVDAITSAAPEVQNAMIGLFDIKSAFDSGALTVGEYGITDKILGDLKNSGVSDELLSSLKNVLGVDDFSESVQFVKDSLKPISSEYQDIIDYYQQTQQEIAAKNVDVTKTVFGNIDTNNRQVLEWTDDNLSQYADAIQSYEMNIDELRGSVSTIIGSCDEFDGVDIAFSPMLQTENGAVLLDSETVHEYIWGLIDEAGEGWTNDDLLRLDTEGLEFDGIQIKNLIADIGESAAETSEIMHYVGEDGALNGTYKELQAISKELGITVDELLTKYGSVEDYVNSLSGTELTLAYKVLQENGSMSIEELQEKIKQLRYESAAMVEPLDFTDFVEGLDKVADSVDKVVSAMGKLASGTALTKKEMMELVAKYPKLLQQADIFAEGNVEAQRNALNSILDMKEQEYDAEIDAKIAELKATKQVLDDQLELEEKKANLINDIKNAEVNGKVEQEEAFLDKLNEFNDLQGQNFVSLVNGEVKVNEEALNDQLKQGADFGEASAENIWEPLGQTIVKSHEQGYTGALTATNNYTTSLWGRIKNFFSNIGSAVTNAWNDMWSGNWKNIGAYFSKAVGTGTETISGGTVSVNFGGSATTINGIKVDDWVSQQEKASEERISKINEIKANTLTAIDNLEQLKGLNLTDIYVDEKSGSKNSSSGKDEQQYFDWIEIRIERLQSAIDKLKNVASGAYNTIGEKLGASFKQIEKINEEINIQKEMYKAYMSYANSVGLSESLAKKVREGAIEISKYDSDTRELIESYKKWYEAALDCSDAVTTLHEDLAALYVDIFNNTKQDFENQISLLEHTQNEYQHELDVIDELSHLGGEKYYKLLQLYEREHIKILGQELDELQKKFEAAMASGEIEKYSDAWYDSKIAINGVKEAIANANIELERYANNLRSANWERFDFAEERISQLIQEADFLIGLFDEEGLTDDKGQFTDKGWSVAGLHAQNYDVYMLQADDYAKEILRVNKELAKDPANTELIERREELLKLQQDSIKSAADEKSAIIDLVKNGIEKELSSLKKLIDTYNESLDSAKNLHDYQKNVAEKATEIANIQKQMAAYANDSSEEAKSKIQKLEVSLKDAQEDLQETEYDRYISEQKQLLDDLYTEYEETINSRLDEVDGLLSEIFSAVNSNADTIASTIRETAADVGYTLTASMAQVWNGQEKDVISKYGQDLSEKLTTLNTVVADIFALAYDKGDANRDGSITVNDARFALRVAQGLEKADAKTLRIADLNGDGKITREEAELILKKATGMKAYASGGLADYTGIAKVDGSKQKPELVLNPNDTLNFLSLRDYLRRISAKPVSIENGLDIQHDLITPIMNEMTDVSRIIRDISIPSAMNSMGDINIQIDHVQDYNDFITQLQHDPKAERMIQAMTLGQATGKGSLSKYGVSWK